MPTIKSRVHKSLSSCINSLNKENHLDFGNRVPQVHKKLPLKIGQEDHANLEVEPKTYKAPAKEIPLIGINLSVKQQRMTTP